MGRVSGVAMLNVFSAINLQPESLIGVVRGEMAVSEGSARGGGSGGSGGSERGGGSERAQWSNWGYERADGAKATATQ